MPQEIRCGVRQLAVEITNHRHRRLLRARRERPRRRRAAEQRDERAPVHCPVPPVTSRPKRIAHLGTAGDCCAAGFQSRLMSQMGHARRSSGMSAACSLIPQQRLPSRCIRGIDAMCQLPTWVPIAESHQTQGGPAETLLVFLDGLDKLS